MIADEEVFKRFNYCYEHNTSVYVEENKKENKTMTKQKYIVRGVKSGVFYGEIKERNGVEVTMTNVRRLWYWDGAASLSQLAQKGTKKPENCKFTMAVDEILVLDCCEIDKCSKQAMASIDGVAIWKV